MTIRHFKIFLAVYEECNITKAAEKIHLAQPSVSLAIKELEEHYKVSLFDRINRKLYRTEKGKEFYQYVSNMLHLYEELENNISAAEKIVQLKIGSSITIGNYVVPQLLSDLKKRYPQGKIYVNIQNSKQIVQSVLANEFDVGLIESKVTNEQLNQIPFMEDNLVFVCSRQHILGTKKKVELQELCKYPFYMREKGSASRDITEGLLKAYQLTADICLESISNHSLIAAVEKNDGITVLPRTIAEEERKRVLILPCFPEAFERKFTIIYHKKKQITPIIEEVIKELKGKK